MAETHAITEGGRLGERFDHNPMQMAEGLGYHVNLIDVEELDGDRYRAVLGRSVPGLSKTIAIANRRPRAEVSHTIAHEIGHMLRLDDGLDREDAERVCDAFAKAFNKRPPTAEEQDRAAWQKIQDDQFRKLIAERKARRG